MCVCVCVCVCERERAVINLVAEKNHFILFIFLGSPPTKRQRGINSAADLTEEPAEASSCASKLNVPQYCSEHPATSEDSCGELVEIQISVSLQMLF